MMETLVVQPIGVKWRTFSEVKGGQNSTQSFINSLRDAKLSHKARKAMPVPVKSSAKSMAASNTQRKQLSPHKLTELQKFDRFFENQLKKNNLAKVKNL